MDILATDWISFFVIGFGTLFILGEVLVNMRGFFALLGLAFITAFFAMHSVNLETSTLIIILIIYFLGLLLIIIDGKLINDGTLAVLGLASMLTSVAIAAPNLIAGLYAVLGVLIGGGASFLFLKIFKQREMWSKLALKDRLTSEAGYSTMREDYKALIGLEGVTLNDLRPVGTVRLNNEDYSVVSNGQWIGKNTKVKVVSVNGTRILVEEILEE